MRYKWLPLFLLLACLAGQPARAEEINGLLLVNRAYVLDKDYMPEDLVKLSELPCAFALNKDSIRVREEVYTAMQEMFSQAEADGVTGFVVTSGYRTRKKQKQLYEADPDVAAKPGQSEHQTGLAFDVTTDEGSMGGSAQFEWLRVHCWDYGFILRYPKGREEITGFAYEPWHYRYVGIEAAQDMYENRLTLEEYLLGTAE